MRVIRAIVITAVVAAALPVLAQAPVLKPGKYAVTVDMAMGAQKMPPQKQEQCITAADLKDMSKGMMPKEMTDACKVSDYKSGANKVSFTATCNQGGMSSTSAFEMSFQPESYEGFIKSKSQMGEMMITMAGKRIGDCTK